LEMSCASLSNWLMLYAGGSVAICQFLFWIYQDEQFFKISGRVFL
jgi:hypothetical protein